MVRSQLIRNGNELYTGHARFVDDHTVLVEDQPRAEPVAVSGRYIVIATGTKPACRRVSSSTNEGCWTPTASSA